MRITWGRGFLRLWIAASLGWAACVFVQLRPDAAWLAVSSLVQPDAKPAAGRAQNAGLQMVSTSNDAFVAAVQHADRAATNKTLLWFAWMVGLPSALALLVGLAARWVVRGFVGPAIRREPQHLGVPSLWREGAARLDTPQPGTVAQLTHRVAPSPHHRA